MLPQRAEGGECFFGEGEVDLYVYCCLLWIDKARSKDKTYTNDMSVGAMKD